MAGCSYDKPNYINIMYVKHICNYKVSFVWWLYDKGIFCAFCMCLLPNITLTNPSIKYNK